MRFQTMAILQYARFRRLGYSNMESQSLGLAFALFYAIMKNRRWYGKKKQEERKQYNNMREVENKKTEEKEENIFNLRLKYILNENGEKSFKMAGKICDSKEWFNKIVSKFRDIEIYNKAIEKANLIISQTDERILKSNNQFFNKIYKPIRDSFVENIEKELTIA